MENKDEQIIYINIDDLLEFSKRTNFINYKIILP